MNGIARHLPARAGRAAAGATAVESAAQHIDISKDDWDEASAWARFPQGIPASVDPKVWLGVYDPPGATSVR